MNGIRYIPYGGQNGNRMCFWVVKYAVHTCMWISNIYKYVNISTPGQGPGGSMSYVVGLPNNSYKPITNTAWVRARLCKLQKGCTRLAAASDKVYHLLARGRWFSPGTPASPTTKTGRHDIAEILLKVALKHQKSINQSISVKVFNKKKLLMRNVFFWEEFEDTKEVIRIRKLVDSWKLPYIVDTNLDNMDRRHDY